MVLCNIFTISKLNLLSLDSSMDQDSTDMTADSNLDFSELEVISQNNQETSMLAPLYAGSTVTIHDALPQYFSWFTDEMKTHLIKPEVYDVCPNYCILYRKEYVDSNVCPK